MKKLENVKVELDSTIEEKLKILSPGFSTFKVRRESIDARRRGQVHKVFTVDVYEPGDTVPEQKTELPKINYQGTKPIVVGTGPCGLFAALRLAEMGIPSLILERGSTAEKRVMKINRYWRYGELDANDNVCFGEGGAGLYSDGKLITRIRSPHIEYVLQKLVHFGAPDEILYMSNPHVGSDRIRRLIPKIREELTNLGCEILFNACVDEILVSSDGRASGVRLSDGRAFQTDHLILATGHSAENIFEEVKRKGIAVEGKSFALGLRIEHPQSLINKIQYREAAEHPQIGPANYKLTEHDHKRGVGVYSFCMCPGGYVLSSGTEADGIVCNGMSNYRRNSPFANSGFVVTVDHTKWFGSDPWGGMKWRREIENKAFLQVQEAGGTKQIPTQLVQDFIKRRLGGTLPTSSPSGAIATRLDLSLPKEISDDIARTVENLDAKMPGFAGKEAQFHGVESRTSCPVRIVRDAETLESISHPGLYPGGEGAGYAGGITSAAVDGINIADQIFKKVASGSTSPNASIQQRIGNS